jgi:hypothetical protein
MEVDNSEENDEENVQERILSLCWDCGELAAVYYDLNTLELHVSYRLKSQSFY